ncbi:MAG: septum formation initiator family protein [Gaiellaceae bacterium]
MANRRATRADVRPKKTKGKRRARPQRTTILLRWCILGVVVLVGFLYYQPLSSYLETRSALNERAEEVALLRQERNRLQTRLERSSTVEALAREARQMRLVRPGERLFIVKGVKEWRRAHAKAEAEGGGATIGGDG